MAMLEKNIKEVSYVKQNDSKPLFTSDLILELEDVLNVSNLDETNTGISVKETEHLGITVSEVVISDTGEKRTGKKPANISPFIYRSNLMTPNR